MKYKILLVDDEEMILSMLEKCLKDKFFVYTADSAKKALELLNVTPDIILLDINMPEMDGFELCQLPYIMPYYFPNGEGNGRGCDKGLGCWRG